MKTEKQDDSILNSLIAWLNKQSQESKLETKVEVTEDKSLASAVVKLAESLSLIVLEMTKLAKSISNVTKTVNEHSEIIQDLYTMQNGILHILKSDAASTLQKVNREKEIVTVSVSTEKKKTEKPN